MSEIKTKLVIRALIGAIMGMLISLFICTFLNDLSELAANKLEFVIQFIGSGLYGAIPMGGSVVYEIESWGLLKPTLIHYFMTMTAFMITNAVLGWFSWNMIIYILIVMTVAYFIIWFVEYNRWKAEIRRMNRDLANMRMK